MAAVYVRTLQYKGAGEPTHPLMISSDAMLALPSLLRACFLAGCVTLVCLEPQSAWSQETPQCSASGTEDTDAADCPTPLSRSLGALKAYVSAPLHWNGTEWLYFGGTLAAIGVAYHFDGEVRAHFVDHSPAALSANTHDVQDALPAAALFLGTWAAANLMDDNDGRREARSMIEASVLSVGTAYALKFAAGRDRPDQTADPGRFRAGGSSFPSIHATAAFAVGTVLAESGNERYRWVRRALGYGVAGFTVYERLNHNAHWLSDTVAGGALGAASAHFAMGRNAAPDEGAQLGLAPLPGGVMLSYSAHLP